MNRLTTTTTVSNVEEQGNNNLSVQIQQDKADHSRVNTETQKLDATSIYSRDISFGSTDDKYGEDVNFLVKSFILINIKSLNMSIKSLGINKAISYSHTDSIDALALKFLDFYLVF